MDRGDAELAKARIDFARRFYQLAAEMGWPEGAEAIARTYDPEYLRRFPIIGAIGADPAEARRWYEKAKELRLNFERGQISRR